MAQAWSTSAIERKLRSPARIAQRSSTTCVRRISRRSQRARDVKRSSRDAKGHILAFANLFVTPSSIILDTVTGQGNAISTHLDKYIIREDVQLAERTSSWRQLLFAGEKASEVLSQLFGSPLPDEPWQHASGTMADREVYVRRVPHAGSTSLAVSCLADDIGALVTAAKSAGVVECESKVWKPFGSNAATPYFGCDVTEDNLPQEVDRNCSAISFDKGCYIGQETVARLDALGHVNKLLVGVTFKGSEVPPTGAELRAGERTVGRVTSATFSPKFNAPLAAGLCAARTPRARLTTC